MSIAREVLDMEMAGHLKTRLESIDRSIALLQELRKETVELFAELFQKDLFDFEEPRT